MSPDFEILMCELNSLCLELEFSFPKSSFFLKDENKQDEILNQRIDAQKKYEIGSTPTILINEKKYKGKVEYSEFKKVLEKNL